MLTPFNDDGSIDFKGLEELTEFYLESGASGLFANCLSSEMFELTDKERLDLVANVVKITNGRVSIVATGTFGETLQKQADFIKKLYDLGIDAVIGITCLLVGENEPDEILASNIYKLLELTDSIPMGFYECPVPYKRIMPAKLLGELVATGRVNYYKDTSLDIENVRSKLGAVNGHEFGLYDAYMVHAVESLKAGSQGLSCIQGNYFPELIVWLCRNYNNPDKEHEIQLVQNFLTENMDIMHRVYPTLPKYYLQSRGLNISSFTRREGIGVLDKGVKQELGRLVYDYDTLKESLFI